MVQEWRNGYDLVYYLEQHNIEILENRKLWEKKPLLRKVYSQFYSEIVRRLNPAFLA